MDVTNSGIFKIGNELAVHRLGYGAMQLCGPNAIGWCEDREAPRRLLQRIRDFGINFVDTADTYGPYINEEQIADALYPYSADMVIGTKGSTVRTWKDPTNYKYDNSPEFLRASVEGSLRRLKLERIPLYQIHRLDGQTPLSESLGCLTDLQREGKIGHLGLSEVDLPTLQAATAIAPIATVQNIFNIAFRKHQPVLEWCENKGIGFIPWFPLGGSTLSGGRNIHNKAEEMAVRLGVSSAQLSIAWLLAKSRSIIVISGTASLKHLEQNVAACNLNLSRDDFKELNEIGVV